jgi:tetratricopeptide (TPR) repeat protein
MVDPISLAAVTAALGAVASGMANEAGKAAWESAGALVRRIAGREVPAPGGAADREEIARLLVDGAARDAGHERAVRGWLRTGPVPGPPPARTARHLPPSVRFFTDRRELLRALSREAARRADGRPRVALLHGPEGIGASTLACHWGHAEAVRFPDGQLHAALGGGAGPSGARDVAVVARTLLAQLGVTHDDVPPATEDRLALYRDLVAGRRLLVVLDDACSAAQVRPFVTSAPHVFTLVVAARPLAGLDAVDLPVGPLGEKDSLRLLTDVAGKRAVAAARAALPSVLERCGGSPLALRAVAPSLCDSGAPAGAPGGRDAAGDRAGPDPLTAVAAGLYAALGADAARVFRRNALWPWPAFDAAAAAHAAGTDERETALILQDLAGRRLLETTSAGRYRYRPALRRFAEQAAVREEGVAVCASVLAATVHRYLETAVRADRAALPHRWWLGPLYTGLAPGPYRDEGEALAALEEERGNLVQAVLAADATGDQESARQLCEALWATQLKSGGHEELLPALRAGARAASALHPGTPVEGRARAQLGFALLELDRLDEAGEEFRAAAVAEETAGHARGRATALESLGLLRLRQWRHTEAYDLFERADAVLAATGPEDDGARDVPRARALLERHRGRALRGLHRHEEATARLETALCFFRATGEAYNTARTLTDLAEVRLDAGEHATAAPLVEEALTLLGSEGARHHLARLRALREVCLTPPEAPAPGT